MASYWRCRDCKSEFKKKETPNKSVTVKCPRCKSDNVEFILYK